MGMVEVKLRLPKRKPLVNTSLFEEIIKKDYCDWNRYVKLFPVRKRSNLEKAMLIYACHVRFISATFNAQANKLLAHQDWQRKWFPEIWNLSLKVVKATNINYNKISILRETVDSDLFLILGSDYDSRIFNLIERKRRR